MKVLIVEDSIIIARGIQITLERLRHEVTDIVAYGENVLAAIEKNTPDIVLMDIRLKGKVDGIEAAGMVWDKYRIPVVFLTAHGDDATLKAALQQEPFGYVLKPYNEDDLRIAIELALHKHASWKKLNQGIDVMKGATNGFSIMGLDGTIKYVNPQGESILGIGEGELTGHPFTELLWQLEDVKGNALSVKDLKLDDANQLRDKGGMEICYRRLDGSKVWIRNRVYTVRNGYDIPQFLVHSFDDITAEKEAEAKKKHLDDLERQFIQNTSHELRTPLTIILGYAEMLDEGEVPPEDVKKVTKIILGRAKSLKRLLDRILALMQGEHGVTMGEKVNLLTLCQNAVRDMAQLAKPGVTLQLGTVEKAAIYGDEDLLQCAIENVVNNAIKFTEKGTVTVNLSQENGIVTLSVTDTGIGIDKSEHGKIFERFYQVDNKTTRKYEGTGIGLAAVKIIIEAHEGEILVESELGKGSTFKLVFEQGGKLK